MQSNNADKQPKYGEREKVTRCREVYDLNSQFNTFLRQYASFTLFIIVGRVCEMAYTAIPALAAGSWKWVCGKDSTLVNDFASPVMTLNRHPHSLLEAGLVMNNS